MDARVKGPLKLGRFVVVVGHGGECWWGRAAGASATTTVTLISVMKEGSLSLVANWVRPEQGQRGTQAVGRPPRIWAV